MIVRVCLQSMLHISILWALAFSRSVIRISDFACEFIVPSPYTISLRFVNMRMWTGYNGVRNPNSSGDGPLAADCFQRGGISAYFQNVIDER